MGVREQPGGDTRDRGGGVGGFDELFELSGSFAKILRSVAWKFTNKSALQISYSVSDPVSRIIEACISMVRDTGSPVSRTTIRFGTPPYSTVSTNPVFHRA
jgi:hypothetical protein